MDFTAHRKTTQRRGSLKIIPNSENTFAVSPASQPDMARLHSGWKRRQKRRTGIMNANEKAVAAILAQY